VAGARNDDGTGFLDTRRAFPGASPGPIAENTTIGAVATNAVFTKTEMTKVAQMAHDGLARAIYPAHTPSDGDTVFALATGTLGRTGNLGSVGALGAEVLAEAILRAVRAADSIPGYPAWKDYAANR
jgi:L-aminopeptidase/D-esterase-like protein